MFVVFLVAPQGARRWMGDDEDMEDFGGLVKSKGSTRPEVYQVPIVP